MEDEILVASNCLHCNSGSIAERDEYVPLSNPLNSSAVTDEDPTARHFYILCLNCGMQTAPVPVDMKKLAYKRWNRNDNAN